MKRTITFLLIVLLGLSVVSCREKPLTTQTTTEVTTSEETTVNNQIYTELSEKLTDFSSLYSDATGLRLLTSTRVAFYMGGDSFSDIIETQEMNMEMVLDLVNPYYYTEYSGTGMDSEVVIFEEVNGVWLDYSLYYDRIQTATLTNPDEEFRLEDVLGEFLDMENTSSILPESGRYYKQNENYYMVRLNLQQLAFLEPEMFQELEELAGTLIDLSEIFVEIIFQFDYQNYDFLMTVTIDPISMSGAGDSYYISMKVSSGVELLDVVEHLNYNLENLKVEGAISRISGIFTIKEEVDETLYLHNSSDNYFRYYFEEGFYYLDDSSVAYGDTYIYLYDSDFSRIQKNKVIEITEAGYYYINFRNLSASNLTVKPYVYKLNEEEVGVPSAPILQTSNTFTLSEETDNTFRLFYEAAPSDGLLVLKTESTGTLGFEPYFTYDKGKTYVNYTTFIIENGVPLAIEFRYLTGDETTYTWEFIPCEQNITTYQDMRVYNDTETEFIYLNRSYPDLNLAFSVSESRTYQFDYSEGSFYGDTYMNVYTEDGTLIAENVLGGYVELTPGNYYLDISASNFISTDAYIYFILEIK